MKDTTQIRPGEELDWQTLDPYLRNAMPELAGEMSVEQFPGGHANLTYLVRFGDRELVVRRPPFGKIAPGTHDMKREYRVLSKLYKFFPQAPRAFHLCEDESILGASFIVMERRTGVVVRYKVPKLFADTPNIEHRLTDALMRTQAKLHTVDIEQAHLINLGKPDGFVVRQLEGAAKRWHLAETTPTPAMQAAIDLLRQDIPVSQSVGLVHNDIKFDNCQFQPDNPDEITSVFDWDMCTIGDPLVDFAATLSFWPDKLLEGMNLPVYLQGDFPDKPTLIKMYADYTGFDVSRINWYQALGYCKVAVIVQQLYARYVAGATQDKRMAGFGQAAQVFAGLALHYAKKQ